MQIPSITRWGPCPSGWGPGGGLVGHVISQCFDLKTALAMLLADEVVAKCFMFYLFLVAPPILFVFSRCCCCSLDQPRNQWNQKCRTHKPQVSKVSSCLILLVATLHGHIAVVRWQTPGPIHEWTCHPALCGAGGC